MRRLNRWADPFPIMRRREFITLLGGAAAWPIGAGAQDLTVPLIGFLNSASPGPFARLMDAFRQGYAKAAMSKAGTSGSSTVGRRVNSRGCRSWRPTSYTVGYP